MSFDPSQSSSDTYSSAEVDPEVREYFARHRSEVNPGQLEDLHIQSEVRGGNRYIETIRKIGENLKSQNEEGEIEATVGNEEKRISKECEDTGSTQAGNAEDVVNNNVNDNEDNDDSQTDQTSGVFTASIESLATSVKEKDSEVKEEESLLQVDYNNSLDTNSVKKSRYASSIGFEFTDSGSAGNDNDMSMTYIHTEDTDDDNDIIFGYDDNSAIQSQNHSRGDSNDDLSNKNIDKVNDSHDNTSSFSQEEHSRSEQPEESLQNDLNERQQNLIPNAEHSNMAASGNSDGSKISLEYEKTSVYVKQPTPLPGDRMDGESEQKENTKFFNEDFDSLAGSCDNNVNSSELNTVEQTPSPTVQVQNETDSNVTSDINEKISTEDNNGTLRQQKGSGSENSESRTYGEDRGSRAHLIESGYRLALASAAVLVVGYGVKKLLLD